MKKSAKKILSLILAAVLLCALLAGCGTGSSASEPGSGSSEPTEAPASSGSGEPAGTDENDPFSSVTEPTGEVFPADELPEKYSSVKYGMYDYETYVALPISEDGDSLTFWITSQPQTATLNIEYEDLSFYRELEERTGITAELTVAPFFTADEVFNVLVSGGEYPDLMSRVANYYVTGADGAVEDEVILPMDDIIDQYMPNYRAWLDMYPEYERAVRTVAGDIWMAGAITQLGDGIINTNGVMMRQDWMDEANITDLPQTYDDYHDMLTAFVANDHPGLWLNGLGGSLILGEGYDVVLQSYSDMSGDMVVYDGVVTYNNTSDNMRDMIALLSSWWDEGLIYSDFMSQTEIDYPDYDTVVNGDVGMWVSNASHYADYETLSDGTIKVAAGNMPRQTVGQKLHTSYIPSIVQTGGTSISTSCEDIELAARWMDYMYTYDGVILGNYGVEGEAFNFADDGSIQYTDLMLNNPDNNLSQTLVLYTGFGTHGIWFRTREWTFNDRQWDALKLWNLDTDGSYRYPTDCKMTVDENTDYNDIMMDIDTYVSESIVRFITGELSVEDDWDDYVSRIEGMHLQDAVSISQTAYDRYMGN